MAESTTGRCPHCGAKTVEYRHTLNQPLVSALRTLAQNNGLARLSALPLTRNQMDNFQKLRYFDLVRYGRWSDGRRRRGWWTVTKRGWRFLAGKRRIQETAVTYRGSRVRYEGPEVRVSDFSGLTPYYRQAPDYASDATPHPPE